MKIFKHFILILSVLLILVILIFGFYTNKFIIINKVEVVEFIPANENVVLKDNPNIIEAKKVINKKLNYDKEEKRAEEKYFYEHFEPLVPSETILEEIMEEKELSYLKLKIKYNFLKSDTIVVYVPSLESEYSFNDETAFHYGDFFYYEVDSYFAQKIFEVFVNNG